MLRLGGLGKKVFPLTVVATACFAVFQANAAVDCSNLQEWRSGTAYSGGDQVQKSGAAYTANWWTQGNDPLSYSGDYQEWTKNGECSGSAGGDTGGGTQENVLPTISFTSPAANSQFTVGDRIEIAVNAQDSDGRVDRVEFSAGGNDLGTVNSAPFKQNYQLDKEGQITITATVYDDAGAQKQASVAVIAKATAVAPDNSLPTVKLAVSANKITQGDKVDLTADASDSDGQIKQVDFYADGKLIGSRQAAPFTYSWVSDKAGEISVYAKAVDNDNGSKDSDKQTISIAAVSSGGSGGVAGGGGASGECRPDGMYQTPGVNVPYCSVYDEEGREKLGSDHQRRIIGYFTSWRQSPEGIQTQYLANDIPWDKITHINYAFVHIDSNGRASVGDPNDPENSALNKTWPGVEIDPALGFKGHFGALATYKKRFGVKTLFAIGGWAETGGHFADDGSRVADGGFYKATTNDDGSINQKGIETLVDSAIEMMRKYQFDGIDIDYEYPTSMSGSGNPLDWNYSEARRPYLMRSYNEMLRVFREKLDKASEQDGMHYMLSIASPASAYLLRGMENFEGLKYLDYVNIMSYDLHGSWNSFVGHNAPLFDTGKDNELESWDVYSTTEYKKIGYLNADWTYHYMRGLLTAGRINIGIPYYSRGWQNVRGGTNGLWGEAPLADQNKCEPGTGGSGGDCGDGALGINNLWHDLREDGTEIGAGVNPMWHAKNLEINHQPTYTYTNGFDPDNNPLHKLKGKYVRYYDKEARAPWLWNEETKTFLSTEDVESLADKMEYIVDKGIGGVLIWELAGDYNCYRFDANNKRGEKDLTEQACKTGQGEYFTGDTLSTTMYEAFKNASPYGAKRAEREMPAQTVDITVSVGGYKVGDENYPINPKITFTNNTGVEIPGGTNIQFDVPTSTPDTILDWSGAGVKVIESGHTRAGNQGGLDKVMHRVGFDLPSWSNIPANGKYELDMVHYLPISGPLNYTITLNGQEYAFAFEFPDLPKANLGGGSSGGNTGGSTGGNTGTTPPPPTGGGSSGTCSLDGVNVYPNWPQLNWEGKPDHAAEGDMIVHNGVLYKANWWTQSVPGSDGSWTKVCP
ncbi:MAG: chitinase C-terminal domain-containing protein [Enterovibrio sp.]